MATVTQILDRMHAINLTVAGVKAKRFFPNSQDPAKLPIVVPIARRKVPVKQGLAQVDDQATRIYETLVIVKAWLAGIPTQSASEDAEPLMDALWDAYRKRPKLQLQGGDALAGVEGVELLEDSGFDIFDGDIPMAAIRIPIAVTTHKFVELMY